MDGALVVTCLCFGAAAYTKAKLTFLPPLLMAACARASGAPWRKTLVVLVSAACLYIALLSPWWIRNAMVFGSFVPFGTNSAQNFYLGNNPRNLDGGNDVDPAVVAKLRAIPDEVQRQRAFSKAATDYIKNNPIAVLRVDAKKVFRFWNIVPNAPEFRTGLLSLVSALSFGPVPLLALVGALRWRGRWRVFVPIYLLVGYFTFVHVAVIASLRYRLPLEPFLILMAAGVLGELFDYLRMKPLRGQGTRPQ